MSIQMSIHETNVNTLNIDKKSKGEWIQIRIDKETKESIQSLAKKAKLPVSQYMLKKTLSARETVNTSTNINTDVNTLAKKLISIFDVTFTSQFFKKLHPSLLEPITLALNALSKEDEDLIDKIRGESL